MKLYWCYWIDRVTRNVTVAGFPDADTALFEYEGSKSIGGNFQSVGRINAALTLKQMRARLIESGRFSGFKVTIRTPDGKLASV